MWQGREMCPKPQGNQQEEKGTDGRILLGYYYSRC
jgi:hypothetical protein